MQVRGEALSGADGQGLQANESMERAADAMLDELGRVGAALATLRVPAA